MINSEDMHEVMKEIAEALQAGNGPDIFKEEFESYGIDFDEIGTELKQMMGAQAATLWICGMHSAFCLAAKHWEYRTPPKE